MRILLIRTDYIGDAVLTSPFISALKRSQGFSITIDVLCYHYNAIPFQHNPNLNQVLHFYPDSAKQSELEHNAIIWNILGNIRYDSTFVLNRDYSAYKLLRKINTDWVFGHKFGVRSIRSRAFCFITGLVKKFNYIAYDNHVHEVENQIALLNFALGKLEANPILPNKIDQTARFYLPEMDDAILSKRNNDTIILNVSGRINSNKYIPYSLAQAIIESLLAYGKQVIIVAMKDDHLRISSLITKYEPHEVILYSNTSLLELAKKLNQYSYYIGADGGLLHIAAGLGLKCVGLFHNQSIDAWHPWTPTQKSLQSSTKCIWDLTANDVIDALVELNLQQK
jgi:heptosyltransferase III